MTHGGWTSSEPTAGSGPQWDAYPPGAYPPSPYPPGAYPPSPYPPGAYPPGAWPAGPYPAAAYPPGPYTGPYPGACPAVPPPGLPFGYAGYGQPRRSVRRSVRELGAALFAVGAVGVIGSVAPWARERYRPDAYRFHDVAVTASGLDGDGAITVALSGAVAVLGALLVMRTLIGLSIAALCCGAGSMLVGLIAVASINSVAREVDVLGTGEISIAWGLWLVTISGALAAILGLIALLRGRWVEAGAESGGWAR